MVARWAAAFASGDWLSARAVFCNEVAPGARRECSAQNRSQVVTAESMALQCNTIEYPVAEAMKAGDLDAVFRAEPAVEVCRWWRRRCWFQPIDTGENPHRSSR
jgi:hypothetical protein